MECCPAPSPFSPQQTQPVPCLSGHLHICSFKPPNLSLMASSLFYTVTLLTVIPRTSCSPPSLTVCFQHGSQDNPFQPEVTSWHSFSERNLWGSCKLASTPTHLISCPTAFLLAYVSPDPRAPPQTSQACLYLKAYIRAAPSFWMIPPHTLASPLLSDLDSSVTGTETFLGSLPFLCPSPINQLPFSSLHSLLCCVVCQFVHFLLFFFLTRL